MEIHPIAYFHSPLTSKFGIPRQSGLVSQLAGTIVFEPPYRQADGVRGLEDFDYLWLVWEFSANRSQNASSQASEVRLTVRPPRLGGNRRMGVFATRSPFRPNPLGLSCVRLSHISYDHRQGPVIHVLGADLMDGTPIYDIKPYVTSADSYPDARCGFVDQTPWQRLKEVVIPDEYARQFTAAELASLREILALDPRPAYHDDASRVYGMPFAGHDVHFCVEKDVVRVLASSPLRTIK